MSIIEKLEASFLKIRDESRKTHINDFVIQQESLDALVLIQQHNAESAVAKQLIIAKLKSYAEPASNYVLQGNPDVVSIEEIEQELSEYTAEAQVDESMRDLRSPISDIMLRWERGVNLYETTTEILQLIRPYLRSQPQAQPKRILDEDAFEKAVVNYYNSERPAYINDKLTLEFCRQFLCHYHMAVAARKIWPEPSKAQPTEDVVEAVARAIQNRYWCGDLDISISDANTVCMAFAKAAIAAMPKARVSEAVVEALEDTISTCRDLLRLAPVNSGPWNSIIKSTLRKAEKALREGK